MADHTMGRRKTQSKPYDDLAISRAIAKVGDPALQVFLTAVVDVVTGISGAQQIRNVEQREALASDIASERQQVYEALRDVRYQVAEGNRARQNNAEQVAKGLSLILSEQESAKQAQALLASNFSSLAENMSELVETVKEHAATLDRHEAMIQDFIRSRDESIRQRTELQAGQDEIRAVLARIEIEILKPEERAALRKLLDERGGG